MGAFFFVYQLYICKKFLVWVVSKLELWEQILIFIRYTLPWALPAVIILSGIFEFTKIPVNPWSWIFKKFSGVITKDTNQKIEDLEQKIDDKFEKIVCTKSKHYEEIIEDLKENKSDIKELSKQFDVTRMENIRAEILRFSNSVRNGQKHSQEEWFHIIDRINEYHKLIEKRELTNGVIEVETQFIYDSYRRCSDTNDFSNMVNNIKEG